MKSPERTPSFDLILCEQSADGYNPVSLERFLDIPLPERITLIQQKKVRFFRGEEEVPVFEALQSIQT